jgi:hypothetical protein
MHPFVIAGRLIYFHADARAIAGPEAGDLAGRPVTVVTAHWPGVGRRPLMLIDVAGGQGRLQGPALRALSRALLPAMRSPSLGLVALLALGGLVWPPLLGVALVYAGWRAVWRWQRRREIEAELASHLIGQVAGQWPPAADAASLPAMLAAGAAAYRSVRSFQISGNSTTSSILRR